MGSAAFSAMASAEYSTKRNPVVSSTASKAVANLTSVYGTPLMPIDTDTVERYEIKSPRKAFVIYFEGSPDIVEGDYVVYGTVDYPVRGVGPWPTNNAFLEVIVEKIK